MDEELKAIQSDLDNVLDRLANYMCSDKLQNAFNPPQPSDRDKAARAAFCYAKKDGCTTLESAVHISRRPARGPESYPRNSRLSEANPKGSVISKFMDALRAINDWDGSGWPLEDCYMELLGDVVRSWAEKECSYLGENVGLDLTKRKEVDPKRWLRETVAWEAFALHLDDPGKYPVSEQLFELVGKEYGMSSSVVKRAYYSERPRMMREAFKEQGFTQWSDTEEN